MEIEIYCQYMLFAQTRSPDSPEESIKQHLTKMQSFFREASPHTPGLGIRCQSNIVVAPDPGSYMIGEINVIEVNAFHGKTLSRLNRVLDYSNDAVDHLVQGEPIHTPECADLDVHVGSGEDGRYVVENIALSTIIRLNTTDLAMHQESWAKTLAFHKAEGTEAPGDLASGLTFIINELSHDAHRINRANLEKLFQSDAARNSGVGLDWDDEHSAFSPVWSGMHPLSVGYYDFHPTYLICMPTRALNEVFCFDGGAKIWNQLPDSRISCQNVEFSKGDVRECVVHKIESIED